MPFDVAKAPSPNFGEFWIARIEDFATPSGDPSQTFPQYDEAGWDKSKSLIPESSWTATGGGTITRHGTWIVSHDNRITLIDTSLGNGKRRSSPMIDNLDTDYLDQLAALGVAPEAVDAVIATHLHPDHVGWNTTFEDGAWRPTFPNATYYLPERDVEFWQPGGSPNPVGLTIMDNVFEDSVAPVLSQSRCHVWADVCQLTPGVTLEPAPGHTPGTCVVKLRTAYGQSAVFTGDILHSAVQVANPHWSNRFCEDQVMSAESRVAVLTSAAEENSLVLAAHFGAHAGFRVSPRAEGFEISDWHEFASIG